MTQPVGYVNKHAEYEKWLKDQQTLHNRYRELVDMSNKYRQSHYGGYGGIDMMEVVDELPYISYEDYKNGVSWRDFAPQADFFNSNAYMRKEDGNFMHQVQDGRKGLGERASDGTIYSYIITDAHNQLDRDWKEANPDLYREMRAARSAGRRDPNSPFYDPTWGLPPEQHADAQREAWGWSAAYGDANPNAPAEQAGTAPVQERTINRRGPSTPFLDSYMRGRGITSGPADTVVNTEYNPDGVVYDDLGPNGSGGIGGNSGGMLTHNGRVNGFSDRLQQPEAQPERPPVDYGMRRYDGPFTPDNAGRSQGSRPQTGGFNPMPNQPMPTRIDPKPPVGRADGNAQDRRLNRPTPYADAFMRSRRAAESRGPVSSLFSRFLKDD